MSEKPILFSGEMVRAILEGRKTQMRREIDVAKLESQRGVSTKDGWRAGNIEAADYREMAAQWSPYGTAGDRLWVKETFQWAHEMGVCHKSDTYAVFRATDPDWKTTEGWRWKPSIFMPRRASRITLEIVAVRVERLQGISEDDAKAEGVEQMSHGFCDYSRKLDCQFGDAKMSYFTLWESINGKGSWEKNPWVWVVEFKRV